MSTAFVVWLAALTISVLASRLLVAGLPLRRIAVRLTAFDATLVGLGVAGLTFHCTAMFFRSTANSLPGTSSVVRTINAMGTGSIFWYVVPAVVLLIGFRRQCVASLVLIAAVLIVVGVTMYDHGPLRAHLTAIFAAVLILAGIVAALVLPPWHAAPSNSSQ